MRDNLIEMYKAMSRIDWVKSYTFAQSRWSQEPEDIDLR